VSDEHGYTITELLVAMTASLVVLGTIMMIVQVATRHQDRVAEQVAANQRARPAMTRIVDRLHSACVAPGIAPVQAGSTSSAMIVLSKAGESVSPVPDRYVIAFSGGALTETAYPSSGGEAPKWTFSGTPTYSRQLVDGVSTASLGEPPAVVPVFRYYAYNGGEVEDTPLPTPPEGLSASDAARTVQVDIAFAVAPGSLSSDVTNAIALSDSATLRIEPASEDSAQVNLPCV
jgi:hypothetical protein